MIRYDPVTRTHWVECSPPFVEEMTQEWSDLVQIRIQDEMLVMRRPVVPVSGGCPSCGGGLLLDGPRLRCRDKSCADPTAASRLLASYKRDDPVRA